jgi:hypothetical protein
LHRSDSGWTRRGGIAQHVPATERDHGNARRGTGPDPWRVARSPGPVTHRGSSGLRVDATRGIALSLRVGFFQGVEDV